MPRLVALLVLAGIAVAALPRRRCVAVRIEQDLAVHVLPDGTELFLTRTLPASFDTVH